MIDIIQWRVSIGLWNCCQSAAGPTRRGCRSIKTDSPNRKKLKTRSLVLSLITVLLFVLTLISGYLKLKYNPPLRGIIIHCSWSKVHCTDIVTDINWLQSVALESDTVYPPPHLRLLLLLSGDVEINPGPIIGKKPTLPSLTGLLKSLDNWKKFGSYLTGITSITIKEIEKKYQGVDQQKGALYLKWLEVFPNASWRDVRIALNRCGANALAENIYECEQKSQEILNDQSQVNRICINAFFALIEAINLIIHIVTNELYDKKLIPQQIFDHVNEGHHNSRYLVSQLQSQLYRQDVPAGQYLIDICNVFISQQYKPLTDIATNMLCQLDPSLPEYFPPENCSPDDVQTFTSRMKLQYQYQTIIESGDRVTLGNLVLIERKTAIEHKKVSDHLLRGQVDKVLKMPGINSVNLSDVLQSKQPIVVALYGPPGIGKTTLCRKLLNMWSNEEIKYELVLYCPLRISKFAEAKNLADLFLFDFSKVSNVADWFKKRNGAGLLIIFDGWDASSTQSSFVADIICRKELDQCSVLITSHSYVSSSITSVISRHVQVIGFSSEEMLRVIIHTIHFDSELAQEFIDKKKESDKNDKPFRPNLKNSENKLAVQFINDHHVLSLCYIPLVCFAVIKSYEHHHGNRIHGLTDLYESIVRQIINSHMQSRDSIFCSVLSFSEKGLPAPVQKLCQIAFDNLSMTLSEESLSNVDYLGLMTMNFEGKYQFIHSNIQEFLAAWWITNHKHNEIQELFKTFTNSGKFQMCLRFMAGLTRVQDVSKGSILDESYKQYFNEQQLDFQCQRKPLFGLKMDHYYPFYNRDIHMDCISASKFPTLLFQLLYESPNARLCKELAQSIKNHLLCLNETSLSYYDWLCLNYFPIDEWDLHLGTLNDQTLLLLRGSIFALPCRVLEVKLFEPMTDEIQALCNLMYKTQECYVVLEGGHYTHFDLSQFFSSGLNILHITINNPNITQYGDSNSVWFEESIEKNSKLEELSLKFNGQVEMNTIARIIQGVSRNRKILSFSLAVTSLDQPIPVDVIENLLKHNITLQALSLDVPHKFLPSLVVNVRTPLSALEIGWSSKLTTSLLPHITGLHSLILHEPYLPYRIFESNPSLHTLSLPLDTAKMAIELFDTLKTNTTLKSLRVEIIATNEVLTDSWMHYLKEVLMQNQVLQSFELTTKGSAYNYIPASFLSSLQAGIVNNSSIERLSVPIPLLHSEPIKKFFDIISCKVTLKCYIDLRPDESYQYSSNERKKEKILSLYHEDLMSLAENKGITVRILGMEVKNLEVVSSEITEIHKGSSNNNDWLFNKEDLKCALKEGSLKYRVSTVIIQGEARVGKTSLKSLILSLPYNKVSTRCIEGPYIAYGNFSIDHYATTDGKVWQLVTESEMNQKIIAELQKIAELQENAVAKPSLVEEAPPVESTFMQHSTNYGPAHRPPEEIVSSVDNVSHKEGEFGFESIDYQPSSLTDGGTKFYQPSNTGTEMSGFESDEISLPEDFDVLEFCNRKCDIDRFGDHKDWLYFIDSGGQVQYQKLLFAFMPCTSVLILVVNLSKNLSDPSSQLMQLQKEDPPMQMQDQEIKVDKYSLSVEDMLKQVLSAITSNAKSFQSQIASHSHIMAPESEKIHVVSVGTHRDKLEKVGDSQIEDSINKIRVRLHEILSPLDNVCDFEYVDNDFQLFEIDGTKATRGEFEDPTVEKISQLLKKKAYEIDVPLRWHYFGVILRIEATKSKGILKKTSCLTYGKMVGMSNEDVDNALKFFHTFSMLFYYHKSPAKDIVFLKLHSLIDIIGELVAGVCKSQNNEGTRKEMQQLCTKSTLSLETLKSSDAFREIAIAYYGNEKRDEENLSEKLMGLFEHLKIAAKLENGQFLMPALLPVENVTYLKSQIPLCNEIPFLFYFKNAVPMGLFCAVIVQLLSDSKSNWQIIFRKPNFSNYFTLEKTVNAGLSSEVVIMEQMNYIEVYYIVQTYYLEDGRYRLRQDMDKAITAVMKDKCIDSATPVPAFYCPCSKGGNHIAIVEQKLIIRCENSGDNQSDRLSDNERKEYWSWLMTEHEIKDKERERLKAIHKTEWMQERDESNLDKILRIKDLNYIKETLRNSHFSSTDWFELGMDLDIEYNNLKAIEKNYEQKGGADRCLTECLAEWLRSDVKATYRELVNALKKIKQNAVAEDITNIIATESASKRPKVET